MSTETEALDKRSASAETLEKYYQGNSIHYYIESGTKHFFIKNNTINTVKSYCGIIVPLGEKLVCKIPSTKLPIDLTEQVPLKILLESPHLRQCLNKRYLLICKDEDAFKELSTPEAQIEMSKLRNTIPNLNEMYGENEIEVKAPSNVVTTTNEALNINLSVLETLNASDFSDDEKYIAIKNIEETLEKSDWEYCYKNGPEKVKNLASSYL